MIRVTVKPLFSEAKQYPYDFDQPVVMIGRLRENHIQLPLSTVSGFHAQIVKEADRYLVFDRESVNGTYLNGERLIANHKRELKSGDRIRIQNFELGVELDPSEKKVDSLTTSQLARKLVMDVLTSFEAEAQEKPRLIVMGGVESGKRRDLIENQPITLGRDKSCDISIDHPTVSRKHAEISLTASGAFIRDLSSVNGVYCNDERIRDTQRLHDRDEIRLAQHNRVDPIRLVFCSAVEGLLSRIEEVQSTPIGPSELEVKRLGTEREEEITKVQKPQPTMETEAAEAETAPTQQRKVPVSSKGLTILLLGAILLFGLLAIWVWSRVG